MTQNTKQQSLIGIEKIELLCPICGREIDSPERRVIGGWNCKCGEFIPENLVINPFEGCTHGLNCNCKRERRR